MSALFALPPQTVVADIAHPAPTTEPPEQSTLHFNVGHCCLVAGRRTSYRCGPWHIEKKCHRQHMPVRSGTERSEEPLRWIRCLGSKATRKCILYPHHSLRALSSNPWHPKVVPSLGAGRRSFPAQAPPSGHAAQACHHETRRPIKPSDRDATEAQRRHMLLSRRVLETIHTSPASPCRLKYPAKSRPNLPQFCEREPVFWQERCCDLHHWRAPCLHWHELLFTALSNPRYRCVPSGQASQNVWPCSS